MGVFLVVCKVVKMGGDPVKSTSVSFVENRGIKNRKKIKNGGGVFAAFYRGSMFFCDGNKSWNRGQIAIVLLSRFAHKSERSISK